MPTEQQYQQISLDVIDDPQHAVRSELALDKLQELADDIKRHGLIEPIILKKIGQRYEVIAGHRRTQASRMAALATVPAIVREVSDSEALGIKLAENAHRQDIEPLEEGAFYAEVVNSAQYTAAEIGKMIGRSEAYIQGRISLLLYPRILQDAIDQKQISLAAAKWLNKVADEAELARLLDFAIKGGITEDMAENFYNHWKAFSNINPGGVFDKLEPTQLNEIARPRITCEKCGEQDDVTNMILVYIHRGGCPQLLPALSDTRAPAGAST